MKISSIKVSVLLLGAGLVCLLAAQFIDSKVDENGMLHEPFALIPLAWLMITLSLLVGLICLIRAIRNVSAHNHKY